MIKKMLICIYSSIFILALSILITAEVINSHPDTVQQAIDDQFNEIKSQLEFDGLTGTVKKISENYSKEYDGYSNLIITNEKGDILYKINSGYVSEKNRFLVLVDPWQASGYGSDIAYLIDSNNSIRYLAQIDSSHNINRLKEDSSRNSLSTVLFPRIQDTDDYLGNKVINNSDGSSYILSIETKIVMKYEYIASKGLYLYALHDSEHEYNNYYLFTDSINTLRHWLIIFTIIFLAISWILLPLWVFKDVQKQHLNAPLWIMITILLNVVGLCIYILFKTKNNRNSIDCKKAPVNERIMCPHCGKEIEIEIGTDTPVDH
ncbi:MAG TPA: hypothetical protein VHT96_04545 [Clostridia bacterium]|nr:hypothetical protein [Clostridia bacterium]